MAASNASNKPKVRKSFQEFRGMFKGMSAIDSSENTTALIEKIDEVVTEIFESFSDSHFHTKMGIRGVLVNGGSR